MMRNANGYLAALCGAALILSVGCTSLKAPVAPNLHPSR